MRGDGNFQTDGVFLDVYIVSLCLCRVVAHLSALELLLGKIIFQSSSTVVKFLLSIIVHVNGVI